MKTLIILRHGKSLWDNPMLRDNERPLTPKGVNRTHLIAEYLKKNSLHPDLIISSPAVRAFETAKIAADVLNYPQQDIIKDENLYFVDTEQYFHALFGAPETVSTLMIVGHNPMITEFCNEFLKNSIDNLPTSGLCVIRFQSELWNESLKAQSQVEHLVFPKHLEKS
jgi:phosphohistidine phosphatase